MGIFERHHKTKRTLYRVFCDFSTVVQDSEGSLFFELGRFARHQVLLQAALVLLDQNYELADYVR